MATDNELRDSLYQSVYREFVGPVEWDSEEILVGDTPKQMYSAGVLYPIGAEFEEYTESSEDVGDEPSENNEAFGQIQLKGSMQSSSASDEDEPIALSNADYQSAISITFCIGAEKSISAEVFAAQYAVVSGAEKPSYKRIPIHELFEGLTLPTASNSKLELSVPGTDLSILVVYRYPGDNESAVFTAALRNTKKASKPKDCSYKECYYQCRLRLTAEDGFSALPERFSADIELDEEERSSQLIYRTIHGYAKGHGCATEWEDSETPHFVETAIMPMTETKPVKTSVDALPKGSLDMFVLGNESDWESARTQLSELCEAYEKWILSLADKQSDLHERYRRAAKENIEKCSNCLARMKKGLNILDADPQARKAFQLANQAMLLQYLHYSVVSNERSEVGIAAPGIRFWRPFQAAFVLLNIDSMVNESSEERNLLDLIWFPTGGGKTEAYLGLSAFTLILERLRNENNIGSTIIMRYTLRLLTAQQFDRAASLICALEHMRSSSPSILGEKRFSIGLWAGGSASPNNWDDALGVRERLARGEAVTDTAIPVSCCPWCGAEMGVGAAGYEVSREGRQKVLTFVCPDKQCEFGSKKNPLPLQVVDEGIYLNPPSILLGTVDKFAMIPFREGSYSIFGFDKKGNHVSAPKLIIQDELHLISGPLGSMVGHYETLISNLCTLVRDGQSVSPKIIASTATVSRAPEQCHELFACGKENVIQFPPSGIDYDDSFFSAVDRGADGRRYVGLYVPNLSFATASIRLYSQLLWTPAEWELENDEERDPYWTVIGYYGTTRELGQAVTWVDSDIQERLYEKRKKSTTGKKRYLNRPIELTGRIDAPEVKKGLESLKNPYPQKDAVDLCLATNMISVGLDVSRLGLMVMAGQPKQTSEYIQASSRVGRGSAKGVVFVMYGTQRPRDRSHYENFKNYHESFYQHVEPSSVTSFCPQVRDRAMPGTLIGLYRSAYLDSLAGLNGPNEAQFERAREAVLSRIQKVDSAEFDDAQERIAEIEAQWEAFSYGAWQDLHTETSRMSEKVPLAYPRGVEPNPSWGSAGFELPTSLRSVDKECSIAIIGRYGDEEDEQVNNG